MMIAAAMGSTTAAMGAATAAMGSTTAAMGSATATMRATHRIVSSAAVRAATPAMRPARREMPPAAAMRSATMRCEAATRSQSAMGCRSAVEPRRTSASRSRSAKVPATAMKRLTARGPKPRRTVARPRTERANAGCIKTRACRGIGVGDTTAMGRVVHPHIARKPKPAAGNKRKTGGVDGDPAMFPIDPAPAPERSEHRELDGWRKTDPEAGRKSEPDRHRKIIRRVSRIRPSPVNGRGIDRGADGLRLRRQYGNGPAARVDHTPTFRRLFEISCRHRFLQKALDRGHHVGLLGEEGIAKRLGPLQLVTHDLQDSRKRHQRLDAGIPALNLQRGGQCIAL